jgi:hypothetical protein
MDLCRARFPEQNVFDAVWITSIIERRAMKRWNSIILVSVLVIGMALMSGCTDQGPANPVPATTTPTTIIQTDQATPDQTVAVPVSTAPVLTTVQTQPARDPIIGSWMNGMVFNADGTVGSDGYTTWRENPDQNNSYFVLTNAPSGGGRSVTSAEWIYNPASDKIYMRGSSVTYFRGVPKATPKPTVTTVGTTVPASFSMEDYPGTLSIHTGGLGTEATVFIARDGSNVPPISSIYDSYGNIVEDWANRYIQVKILPAGDSKTVSLAPGAYTAYLPDKNGGVPEQQSFTINANSNTVITFSGFSYRAASGGGCGG